MIQDDQKSRAISLSLLFKGMAMGMAEIIPGVSGGTLAFITGIYERLMNAIKSISGEAIIALKREGLRGFWRAIDGNFLLVLFMGMAGGLVIGAIAISYLLEHYPLHIWGFFFGLILASFFYVLADAGQLHLWSIVALVVGTLTAYFITEMSPAEGSTDLLSVGMSGAIAVTALLLPGISGSFILLLLGMYTYILSTFRSLISEPALDGALVLLVFGVGCVVGAVLFSRVISWTFSRFRTSTLALLAGFLLGSLNKIWPWRIPELWTDETGRLYEDAALIPDDARVKLLSEANVMPGMFPEEPHLISVLIVMIIGASLVYLLSRSAVKL